MLIIGGLQRILYSGGYFVMWLFLLILTCKHQLLSIPPLFTYCWVFRINIFLKHYEVDSVFVEEKRDMDVNTRLADPSVFSKEHELVKELKANMK